MIDSRIALGLRPVELPSPLEAAGKALSLRSMLDESSMRQFQMQQAQQAMQDRDSERQALSTYVSGDRSPQSLADIARVSPSAYFRVADEDRKARAATLSEERERRQADAAQMDAAVKAGTLLRNAASGVSDQATWDAFREEAGRIAPGQARMLPAQYSPDFHKRYMMTADDWLKRNAPTAPEGMRYNEQGELVAIPGFLDMKKQIASAGATRTNVVTNVMGKEADKAYGKFVGEAFADIQKAGLAAPGDIGRYQQLGSLLSQVNTGKFAGTTQELKAAAKGLGMDLTALGVRDDIAPAQAAKALSAQMALELRNPAGGAGMPGALSDKDREFLQSMVPGIENDPGAIRQMIDYRVRLAKRNQQVAGLAREYAAKNGGNIDNGFFTELQRFSDANPLFPEAANQRSGGAPRLRRFNQQTGRIE